MTGQPMAGASAPGEGTPSEPGADDPAMAGDGTPADAETPPAQAGDGSQPGEAGDTPSGVDCDADPHHWDCIDTHVRGKCDIDTGYPGDDACLLPPPPGKGIQIHIGPDDYDDMAQLNTFLFAPGNESSECFKVVTENDEPLHYQGFVLSGRDGTHHIINTAYATPHAAGTLGTFSACRFGEQSIGRIPGAAKPYMERRPVAPENETLGYPLAANTPIQSDMHYFNYTEAPILREYWLNLYTIPDEEVTETPNQIRGYGGLGFNITPGTDRVSNYKCPIDGSGRITALLGHTHAHAVRFTAWVNRTATSERLKVFESFDYLEPQIFSYNTIEQNPEFSESSPGGFTGILEVADGDEIEWECHVINDSDSTLRFTNFVDTGEMCNIWGESVGANIQCDRF